MTSDIGNIQNPRSFYDLTKLSVSDSCLLPVKQVGKAFLHTGSRSLLLSLIYHVPNLTRNLISIAQLCHKNSCAIDFNGSSFSLKDKQTGKVLLKADSSHGLYYEL